MMIIKGKKFILLYYIIIYKLLLDIAYVSFVHNLFDYMGFKIDFNLYKYLSSFAVCVLMYSVIPKDQEKPSSIFIQLHFIIMIMPIFTIYAFMNQSNAFFIISMGIFMLQCIVIRLLPNIKIIKIKNSKHVLYTIIVGLTFFVYYSMIRANGIPSLKALDVLNVYDIRKEVSYPFLMTYFVNWQAKVINPFLITISYLNKEWKLLSVSIFLQLLLYLITAHKTFLFIPLAIIVIIKILPKLDFFKTSIKISALATFIMLVFYKIAHSILLPSFFIRRFLFVPAQIKFYYYDFFSRNEFLYFSTGTIGKVLGLEYKYNLPPAYMIGDKYFNNPLTGANTGYIADAYANMGFSGMLLITIFLIMVLKLIDSLSIKAGRYLTVGLAIYCILSLNDCAFLTTLLTGGLLLLLLVLYLYSSSLLEE